MMKQLHWEVQLKKLQPLNLFIFCKFLKFSNLKNSQKQRNDKKFINKILKNNCDFELIKIKSNRKNEDTIRVIFILI